MYTEQSISSLNLKSKRNISVYFNKLNDIQKSSCIFNLKQTIWFSFLSDIVFIELYNGGKKYSFKD